MAYSKSFEKVLKMTQRAEYVVDADKRKLFDWSELWAYKELFYFFTWRDIKIKYKQTALGFLWAILQPLLMMMIFTLFFGRALKLPLQKLDYPVFVFSGLLIWNIFSSGLTNSANSMVTNGQIIKKIYFPRLIIPVSSILVALFDFLMAFVLFAPVLIFYDQPVDWMAFLCWPAAIAITAMATLGPGCLMGALNVKYRDFRYVIPFVVQVMFFLTPIIYPVSIVEKPVLQYILAMSPVYAALELFRYPLAGEELNMTFMAISLGTCFILLVVGLVYFKRAEDFFADFA